MLWNRAEDTSNPDAVTESGNQTSPLQIDISEQHGRTYVTVVGELDGVSAPPLRDRLDDFTGDLAGDLLLDIAGLSFIDSTGLTLFVELHQKLDSTGHRLILLHPTPMARRILGITRLDGYLRIEPTDLL